MKIIFGITSELCIIYFLLIKPSKMIKPLKKAPKRAVMHIDDFLYTDIRFRWTMNYFFLQQHQLLQIVHTKRIYM